MASTFTPAVAIHVMAALGAVATGAVALYARRRAAQHPRLHRAFGYAWVTLMVVTAISALFVRSGKLPNIAGFSPIHLLVPVTLSGIVGAFVALARGQIAQHKKIMQGLYLGACIGAGVFTLLPGRLLGQIVWGDWLGLVAQETAAQGAPLLVAGVPIGAWSLIAGIAAVAVVSVRRATGRGGLF